MSSHVASAPHRLPARPVLLETLTLFFLKPFFLPILCVIHPPSFLSKMHAAVPVRDASSSKTRGCGSEACHGSKRTQASQREDGRRRLLIVADSCDSCPAADCLLLLLLQPNITNRWRCYRLHCLAVAPCRILIPITQLLSSIAVRAGLPLQGTHQRKKN